MNSRPFLADYSKVYDESCFTSAPAQFGQNPLLVTYGQQRRVFDTAATTIAGHPNPQQGQQQSPTFQQYGLLQQQPQPNQNFFTPLRQNVQSGVAYSFPNQQQPTESNFRQLGIDFRGPQQGFNVQRQPFQHQFPPLSQAHQPATQMNPQPQFQIIQPHVQQMQQPQIQQFPGQCAPPPLVLTLEQQIALNELQKHALETMLLHDLLKKQQYKWKLHFDGQTDTNDLPSGACSYSKNDMYPTKEPKQIEQIEDKPPEALHSEAAKRRQLVISVPNETRQESQDKEAQNVPEINSVEIQCEALTGDNGTCTKCPCEQEMQTDRRVAFGSEPPKILKKKKNNNTVPNRSVNDDSDSSSSYEDAYDTNQ